MVLNYLNEYIHEGLVMSTRSAYPLPFGVMTGLWGILLFRREQDANGKRPLTWVANLFASFALYAYSGGILIDVFLLGRAPTMFQLDYVLIAFLISWSLVNYFPGDHIAKFLTQTPVFLCVEACMILDAASGGLNIMEHVSNNSDGQFAPFFWMAMLFVFVPPLCHWFARVHMFGNSKAQLEVPAVCYIFILQQGLYWATMLFPCMKDKNRAYCHQKNIYLYVAATYGTFVLYLAYAFTVYREYAAGGAKKKGARSRGTSLETKKRK